MNFIIQKLTSRKFWVAIAGIATGVALFLGGDGSDITTIAGAVTTIISSVVYMIVEGKVDADRVKNSIEGVQTIVDTIQDTEDIVVKGFGDAE